MHRKGFAAAAAVVVVAVGVFLFVFLRDRSVVVAVPRPEVPVYVKVFDGLAKREGAPGVRLLGFDGDGAGILTGRRPGLAVVAFASWTRAALSDGRLAALPSGAPGGASDDPSKLPQAFLRATSSAGGGPLRALPIAFDPWLAFWHRDFIGGAAAAPPRDWNRIAAAAAAWKRGGVSALALAGREPAALAAWLAIQGGARGPAAVADALGGFPAYGREVIAEALGRLAALERDGIVQTSAFSYPWADAVDLVLKRRAAGIILPLSRFRAINPAASAPLVIARVPDFAGVTGAGLVAELRVLVMPSRGARGKGVEKVISFLAEPGTQRAIADGLGMAPARLDAAVRDGASFEAREAARGATLLLPVPGISGDARYAAVFAEAAAAVLRSPGNVAEAVSGLYGGK